MFPPFDYLQPDFLALFLVIAGFIIGLGALTVIDWHGFLGQKSVYWTVATTRTHKVTKPLIWLGMTLATLGSVWLLQLWSNDNSEYLTNLQLLRGCIWVLMVLNGCFLSFWVSPRLLKREKEGHDAELLPTSWQRAIFVSFIFSFVTWWTQVALFVEVILLHYSR